MESVLNESTKSPDRLTNLEEIRKQSVQNWHEYRRKEAEAEKSSVAERDTPTERAHRQLDNGLDR